MPSLQVAPASSSPAAPTVLRVGVVRGNRVVAERLVRPGETVTVGVSDGNTFTIEGGPERLALFVARPEGGWAVAGGIAGAVSRPDGVRALDTLQGRDGRVAVEDDMRGRVLVGDATFLFQLVPAPPEPIRQIAVSDFRARLIEDDDPLFHSLLAVFTTIAAAFMVWVNVTPLPERADLELVEDLTSLDLREIPRIVIVKPLPAPPIVPRLHEPRPAQPPRPAEAAPGGRPRSILVHRFGHNGPATGEEAEDLLGSVGLDEGLQRALDSVRVSEEAASEGSGPRRAVGSTREDAGIEVDDLDAGHAETTGAAVTVTPRVDVEERPSVSGGDAGSIAEVVRGNQGRVVTCVEQSLKVNPGMNGRVGVGWTVVDGRVTESHLVSNDTGDDALARCVASAVRHFRFGADVNVEVAEFPWIVSGM